MTIEQIIEIPADRRITVELPPNVPTGTARLKLSVSHNGGTAEKTGKISRQMCKLLKLYGCLKDSPVFEGDSAAIRREMRAGWDRPWIKTAKTKYVLDTNIFISFVKGLLGTAPAAPLPADGKIFISIITCIEALAYPRMTAQ